MWANLLLNNLGCWLFLEQGTRWHWPEMATKQLWGFWTLVNVLLYLAFSVKAWHVLFLIGLFIGALVLPSKVFPLSIPHLWQSMTWHMASSLLAAIHITQLLESKVSMFTFELAVFASSTVRKEKYTALMVFPCTSCCHGLMVAERFVLKPDIMLNYKGK